MKISSKNSPPFFSVIIATKNISEEFHDTMKSILTQKFKSYEITLIDSSNNEKSKDIINSYPGKIDHFLNKGDKGIYDAWNQGLEVSKGNWIIFLGSGDTLLANIFDKVFKEIECSDLDLFFTNINLVSKDYIKTIKPNKFSLSSLSKFKQPPHPGIFHNKNLFNKYGNFNNQYKIAGDYEFLLRVVGKVNYEILDLTSVNMLAGGISQTIKVLNEGFRIQYSDNRLGITSIVYNYFRLFLKLNFK